MNITKKQGIAMAAIVAIGLTAGGAVLLTQRHAEPTESAAHAEDTHKEGGEKDHADAAGHGGRHQWPGHQCARM